MKTFYIFEVTSATLGDNPAGEALVREALVLRGRVEGQVTDARQSLKGLGYDAGSYRIMEDTGGIIEKTITTRQEVGLAFEKSRKRGPRQPKAEGVEPKPKKKAGK